MAISTPVNKETLKHHFDYYKWKYLLLVVITVAAWSLIYTMTRPQVPDDKRIDVFVQSNTTSDAIMHEFLDPVWKASVSEEEEELNLNTIMEVDEVTALQQLFTLVHTYEGDIYLLTNRYYRQYASQGVFVPLEELIADGKLNVEGIDTRAGEADLVLERDKNDQPIRTERHLYGIPLHELEGFATGMYVDNKELYACIAVNNGNMDDVVAFFNAMIQAGRSAEAPVGQE